MKRAHRQLNILPPPQVLVLAQPTCVVPFQMACLQRQRVAGRQPHALSARLQVSVCTMWHPHTTHCSSGPNADRNVASAQ